MASTFSDLKIELIATGEQSGTWGSTTNTNLGTAIEQAITGSGDVSFSSADVTLTLTDTNASQTARNLRLNLTGTSGGARNLIVPAIEKQYIVNNGLADTVTVKNSTGTGVAVPAGKTMVVFNNATNVVDVTNHASSLTLGSSLPIASGGTNATATPTSGAVAYGTGTAYAFSNAGSSGQPLLSGGSGAPTFGTLGVAAGGTGQTTYTNGQLLIGNTTGNTLTKATLTAGSGVTITNGTGSITISATGLGGDVEGPASSTDNAFARFNGTTGKLIQNSTGATLDDTGIPTFTGSINVSGTAATAADIKLYEDTDNGTNYVALKAPAAVGSNLTLVLPSADGSTGQALTTDGAGNLSFGNAGISTGKSIAMAMIFGF